MSIREIGASVTLNATDFKKEMSAVNSNLKGMQEELKAVTAETADNAKSVDALTQKQKLLSQMEEQQKVKVDALSKAYEEQAKATGENSVEADLLRKQWNTARAALAKTESQLQENTKALADATRKETEYTPVNEKAAAAVEKLRKRIGDKVKVLQDAAKHTPVVAEGLAALGAAGRAAGKGLQLTGDAMKTVTKAAAGMTAAGLAATGAMAGLAVSGLKTLTEWAKEAAAEVDEDGNVLDERFSELNKNLAGLDAGAAGAKKALSAVLLPALNSLSGAGADLLNGFTKDLEAAEGDTEKMGQVVAEYLTKAVDMIRELLPEFVSMGTEILGSLGDGIVEVLPELLDAGMEIINTLLDAINQYAPQLADAAVQIIMALGEFLLQNAPLLLQSGITMVSTLIQGLTSALPQLLPMASQMIVQIVTGLASNAPELVKMGLSLILALVQGLIEAIPELLKAVPDIIHSLVEGFQAAWPEIKDIGKKIIDGILQGLKDAWAAVKQWFSGAVGGLTGTAKVNVATDGSHAGGLDYVPFDGYIAELHRGERVLTAQENREYSGGGSRVVNNWNIQTNELTPAMVDYVIRRANEELGGDVS